MNDRGADKKAGMPDGHDRKGSETPGRLLATRQTVTARLDQAGDEARSLMEEALRRENVHEAYQRVVRNSGAPGIDGMTVDDLMEHCRSHWPRIREQLLCMSYTPQPVRKVEIPKLDGKGTRMLGISTVLDRMIQQALLQILQPIFDPTFSDASFGFRPGRSTHGALRRAREHIAGGSRWCVDLDFAKFLDSEVAKTMWTVRPCG